MSTEAVAVTLTRADWDGVLGAIFAEHSEFCTVDPDRCGHGALTDKIATQLLSGPSTT